MKPSEEQMRHLATVLQYQYPGVDVSSILGDTRIAISRKTGRIRSVSDQNTLLFSLRTSDGRLLPSFTATKRILQSGYKGNRVVIHEDAAAFVASGKSAYCKHVLDADENIVPGMEVFLVDQNNTLLAVGSAMQPSYAMIELDYGVAAKNKHYVKKAISSS